MARPHRRGARPGCGRMSACGYIAWLKTRRHSWETYPENTEWRSSWGRKMVENGRQADLPKAWHLDRGRGRVAPDRRRQGGHGPINGENENQNSGDYGNLYGMRPAKRTGKGRHSLTCSKTCHKVRISRESRERRIEARSGRSCSQCKGPIPTSRTARAITCSSRCRRTRDRLRKAAEHLPGNGFCLRCRCDISHRRPNAIYCYLCYRINDQYREKISRRKLARAFWMWSIHARVGSVVSDKGTVPDLSGGRSRALNRVAPNSGREGGTVGRFLVCASAVPFKIN